MKKFLLIVAFASSLNAHTLVSKLYCTILGNNDAQPKYTHIIHQALREMGVEKARDVPIKKMNDIGPLFALMPLASFTAHGIWLNETYLDQFSLADITFELYHEAAHYAHKHHQRLILWSTSAALCKTIILYTLYKKLKHKNYHSKAITSAAGFIFTPLLYVVGLPALIKKQEKEADIATTQTLLKTQKCNALKEHLKKLKLYSNTKSLWWPTPQEQISYIKKEINQTAHISNCQRLKNNKLV
jgi:hypothetical protein